MTAASDAMDFEAAAAGWLSFASDAAATFDDEVAFADRAAAPTPRGGLLAALNLDEIECTPRWPTRGLDQLDEDPVAAPRMEEGDRTLRAPPRRRIDQLDPADRDRVRDKLVFAYDSPQSQVAMVEDLAARIESPTVTVQYGPYGAEWCSDALLRLIAERSALTGRRVHMHLLESRLQREFLDSIHPAGGPVKYLDSIGMLSPRLSVAHAVWLRPPIMAAV